MHIDLNIAIEKRKNFDATIDFETIFVQNIDFFDVAIDEIFEKNFEKIINDLIINFDEIKNDEINNETNDFEICAKNETIDFDFFECRMRICSWNLMLLSNLIL